MPIPSMPELHKADMLLMEKETTGIYLSGHPMDDYRQYLHNTRVVNIDELMGEDSRFKDDQIVSVAGVVQSLKMKTTRNNSMMAYVTLEDDTASIEMLAFSKVIEQYGSYLYENSPVVITGRLSIRDEKEPQIVINRARPIQDFANNVIMQREDELIRENRTHQGTLYLRFPSEEDPRYPKVKAILNMFPGESQVVLFFADTKQRRGTRCVLMDSMLEELQNVLGDGNVVMK